MKNAYLAFQDRNIPALLQCLGDDVRWSSVSSPTSTGLTRLGRDQVEQGVAALEANQGIQSFQPKEFMAEGNTVVTFGESITGSPAAAGELKSPWVHIFTLRKGRITEFRAFQDTTSAIAELAHMDVARVR
ncbi:MAG: nuclear transport factor 2 family protein [Pyrinomonadaceae bacterium]